MAYTQEQVNAQIKEGPNAYAQVSPALMQQLRAAYQAISDPARQRELMQNIEAGQGGIPIDATGSILANRGPKGQLIIQGTDPATGRPFNFDPQAGLFESNAGSRWHDVYDAEGNWTNRNLASSGWVDFREGVVKPVVTAAGMYFGSQYLMGDGGLGTAGGTGAAGGTSAGAVDAAALGLDGAVGGTGAAGAGITGGAVTLTPAEIAAANSAATAGLSSASATSLLPNITPGMVGAGAAGGAGATNWADWAASEVAGASSNPATAAQLNAAAAGSGTPFAGGTSSGWEALGRAVTSDAGLKAIGTIGGALVSGAAADALAPKTDTASLDALLQRYMSEFDKTSARADDQWNNYLNTWRPVENKYAQSVLNYDTLGRREQAATEAGGAVASQFDLARSAGLRDAQAAGVDPSTIAALGAASRIEEAKATAGARNNARTNVENMGLSLLEGGARFGRNLPQTSLNASSVATGQGNSAGNTTVAANNMETNATNSRNQLFGDLFGAGLKAYGMFSSSKKTKHMGRKVDGLSAAKAVEKSPAHRWNYKPGQGDGNTKGRMGPTAESLSKVAPEVSDGKKVDGIAMLGLHHAAIGNNSARLRRIEKRLGLSDARKE